MIVSFLPFLKYIFLEFCFSVFLFKNRNINSAKNQYYIHIIVHYNHDVKHLFPVIWRILWSGIYCFHSPILLLTSSSLHIKNRHLSIRLHSPMLSSFNILGGLVMLRAEEQFLRARMRIQGMNLILSLRI